MKILIDMDGVIADFEKGFLSQWRKSYPNRIYIPLKQRKTFYIIDDYPHKYRHDIKSIYNSSGFLTKLTSINGAITALMELRKIHDIYLCSSPLKNNKSCVEEKYFWVKTHLGKSWTKWLIITEDKTLISGELLIDDKPEIIGTKKPSWKHIIFDQPYNRNIIDKKRINWSSWKEILQ